MHSMIKYVISIVALVLMGAPLAYAANVPYWMPFTVKGSLVSVKYFAIKITHATDELGLTKICVTSPSSRHGACHYMNVTEEESQPGGIVFTADAGVFVFHPGIDLKKGDKLQICFTSLTLNRESCFYDKNDNHKTITNISIDVTNMLTHDPELIEKSEIGMFSFGGGVA